jgi:hypothetical protein
MIRMQHDPGLRGYTWMGAEAAFGRGARSSSDTGSSQLCTRRPVIIPRQMHATAVGCAVRDEIQNFDPGCFFINFL